VMMIEALFIIGQCIVFVAHWSNDIQAWRLQGVCQKDVNKTRAACLL